jgi:hypothetical protein
VKSFYTFGNEVTPTLGFQSISSPLRSRDDIGIADAAFVDGSHHFHNVFVDLRFLWGLVRPGGLIILDDCQWPSVATAVRYFELNIGRRPEPIAGQRDGERSGCLTFESNRALRLSSHSGLGKSSSPISQCTFSENRLSGVKWNDVLRQVRPPWLRQALQPGGPS